MPGQPLFYGPSVPRRAHGGGAGAGPDGSPRPLVKTATADASLTATLGPPDPGKAWWITRLSVSCDDTTAAASVYVGGDFVTATSKGSGNDYDANQPLMVPEYATLTLVWSAGTPASCVARIEYLEG